ncbi:hypothetical protein [Bacillus marinisedimentorum]|uniref:hypothetical protein n=1 Tax=Bacillus marinisedimentorum TaxID=1821260 RepID=UPI0012FF7849|nr:hypothetical protein [Bacillus marinisedimentorum]
MIFLFIGLTVVIYSVIMIDVLYHVHDSFAVKLVRSFNKQQNAGEGVEIKDMHLTR